MNAFPPELHDYIVQLACTDDGSSVHALLRVSRYFNAIARPYVFRSLSLCGRDRIARVSALLERTPSHLRHIHHLFISERELPHDDQPHSTRQRSLSYPSSSPLKVAAVLKILSMAAPTLETLAFCPQLDVGSTSLIAHLFRMQFPQLRELSVLGFYPFPATQETMPKLERLHLAGNRNPHGLIQLGGLAAACPSLSHLRVSSVAGAVAFSEEICAALCRDEAGRENPGLSGGSPGMLPRAMRLVMVQPGNMPGRIAGRVAVPSKHEMMMLNFRELRQRTAERGHLGARFEFLESEAEIVAPALMRSQWAERIEGRDGCWVGS